MPAVTSLEEELQSLGQAAQAGVISETEAIGAAQQLIMQAEQARMAPPSIPRALAPSLDTVIGTPYQGPDGFGGAVGEALKATAIGLGAKLGIESLLPKLMFTKSMNPEVVDALHNEVMAIKPEDLAGLKAGEQESIKKAQKFLSGARGTRTKGPEVLAELTSLKDSLIESAKEGIGSASSHLREADIPLKAVEDGIRATYKAETAASIYLSNALKAIDQPATLLQDGNGNVIGSVADQVKQSVESAFQRVQGNAHGLQMDLAHAENVKGFIDGAEQKAASTLGHLNLSEEVDKVIHVVTNRTGTANKVRVEITPGMKTLLGVAVAAGVVYAGYRGCNSAEEAKKSHAALQATTAGTREDYAHLYNQASDMAAVLNQPAMRTPVINMPSAVIPSAMVSEASAEGQGINQGGLQPMTPGSSASRAEMLDHQRQLAAMQQGNVPAMN